MKKYPEEILERVKKIIQMYQRISEGKETDWVCLCLCDAVADYCSNCPAYVSDSICLGPGGQWKPIKQYVYGRSERWIKHFYSSYWTEKRILAQARRKAKAWQKWLNKQRKVK